MMGARLHAIVTAVFLAGAGMADASPAETGRVLWVIDGDTYQIHHIGAPQGEPVRARHFDTPERGDRAECDVERGLAERATAAARQILPRGAEVYLSDIGRDRYGRLLATVTLADGTDLASWFIEAGLAVPYQGGRRSPWCGRGMFQR